MNAHRQAAHAAPIFENPRPTTSIAPSPVLTEVESTAPPPPPPPPPPPCASARCPSIFSSPNTPAHLCHSLMVLASSADSATTRASELGPRPLFLRRSQQLRPLRPPRRSTVPVIPIGDPPEERGRRRRQHERRHGAGSLGSAAVVDRARPRSRRRGERGSPAASPAPPARPAAPPPPTAGLSARRRCLKPRRPTLRRSRRRLRSSRRLKLKGPAGEAALSAPLLIVGRCSRRGGYYVCQRNVGLKPGATPKTSTSSTTPARRAGTRASPPGVRPAGTADNVATAERPRPPLPLLRAGEPAGRAAAPAPPPTRRRRARCARALPAKRLPRIESGEAAAPRQSLPKASKVSTQIRRDGTIRGAARQRRGRAPVAACRPPPAGDTPAAPTGDTAAGI